jgi:hypothetical protein
LTPGEHELRSSLVDHRDQRLTAEDDGGFRLDAAAGSGIAARPGLKGWEVSIPGLPGTWQLSRNSPETRGFLLLSEDRRTEAGRTMPVGGVGSRPDLYYLLLRDGCLFRIGSRGAREAGFELSGWETPGAYLVARPGSGDWTLVPTPACGGLPDIRALSILFAAEILESEALLGQSTAGGRDPE